MMLKNSESIHSEDDVFNNDFNDDNEDDNVVNNHEF